MGKKPRSFSIDEDIDRLLSEKDDLNASAAVSKFLREFLASGRGDEAALAVRLEQVESELADARKEVEQLEREQERLQAALDERRSDMNEALDEFESMVRSGDFPAESVEPSNPAVQNYATQANVSPRRFVDELRTRLD